MKNFWIVLGLISTLLSFSMFCASASVPNAIEVAGKEIRVN
jgi:hypothetical protein